MNKYLWLAIFFGVFIWSGTNPKDRLTWLLEVAPAMIGIVVLVWSYNTFRLTGLLYFLILLHCIVLMVGGHYTYAEVPLFDVIKELAGSSRNNYDKVGHFFQGFVPALIVREIIIRKDIVTGAGWRVFFTICVCMALSAFYELIEWWVALASGQGADAFLGTQGYVWDTQSDMALAMTGAIVALLALSRVHDKQLGRL